jgi:thiol-disulfide isomerase/thioredoxin
MKHNGNMMDQDHSTTRRSWLWGAGAAAGLAGAGLAWWRLSPKAAEPVDQHAFWTQSFESPSGEQLPITVFKGQPLLVNFWATWCPPCVDELPLLDRFWRENASKKAQVLALAIDQPSAVKKFLLRQPLGFPIGLAGLGGTELAKSLGNAAGGLPFSVFFNADGSIWRQKLGQLTQEDLDQWQKSWPQA